MKKRIWIQALYPVHAEPSNQEMVWLKQRKFLKVMDRSARQALQAAHLAWAHAAEPAGSAGENCGVIVSLGGVNSGVADWNEARADLQKNKGTEGFSIAEIGKTLPPLSLIPRLPNSIAGHIARELGATGPCYTSGSGGMAGLDALVQGARWIIDGECESVLVLRVEEEGALALLLESERGGEKSREILSWLEAEPEGGRTHGKVLSLRSIGDWEHWKDADCLHSSRAGIQLEVRLNAV